MNVDVYPIEVGTKFTLVLASTLNTDGSPEDPTTFDQSRNKETLAPIRIRRIRGSVIKDGTERRRFKRNGKDGDVHFFRRVVGVRENGREGDERGGR